MSWKDARKKLRQARVRLLRNPGAPTEIAGGMALGLFIALQPLMGLQTPVALFTAELLRRGLRLRLSRVSATAGVWLTNPLTAAPIYTLAYVIGLPFARMLLSASPQAGPVTTAALELGRPPLSGPAAAEALLALVIGGALLGLPVAWLGYRLTYGMVMRHHARRARRRALRTRDRGPLPDTVGLAHESAR